MIRFTRASVAGPFFPFISGPELTMASKRDAAWMAVHHFGLGARPGELKSARDDPRGWLAAQLEGPHSGAEAALSKMPSHGVLLAEGAKSRGDKQAHRRWRRGVLEREVSARLFVAATTRRPFRERWARFFSNHLCVSATKKPILATVGAYEREAVRPHDTGRFGQLVRATTRHPAMLLYLDNQRSTGPDSPLGRRKGLGLNENLARELLELHTLGVDGGYGQHDVIALAQMLTGWTVRLPKDGEDDVLDDVFVFAPRRHQPGAKRLLDTAYPLAGVREAEAAIDVLAVHPSTARHLSTKLARHFVADAPPPEVVALLERAWLDTEGDLKAVGTALVTSDGVWDALARVGPRKLRTPEELIIAMARSAGVKASTGAEADWADRMVKACAWLGQPPLAPPSPQGWPDEAADWAAPEQVLRRVELAETVGRRLSREFLPSAEPVAWAREVLGPSLDADLQQRVARAPDRATAFALVLASPAFQWR